MSNITYPYFSAPTDYYEKMTEGMSDKARQSFANALAHHMMPVFKNKHGWWLTRHDYIVEPKRKREQLYDLVDNDGNWKYRVEFKE